MSFVFRGTRADIESGFPGHIPERPAMRIHAARPVSMNSLAFLVTVILLFMILNSHQMSPNFLLWLVVGVFLMATTLRMFATCQQLQTQARSHAAAASGMLSHTELRLHMPPSIAFATRGRLQGLRLQLALLDHYDTLRALDSDNASTATSMSEEEINALPVHKHKVTGPENVDGSSLQHASSSSTPVEASFGATEMDADSIFSKLRVEHRLVMKVGIHFFLQCCYQIQSNPILDIKRGLSVQTVMAKHCVICDGWLG
ncbi:unnamed protein product [Malus baccata var. baccata]